MSSPVGALKKNAVLQELCLASNDLNSYQDSMQLGELLKNNRSLRSLDLSNNLIADEGKIGLRDRRRKLQPHNVILVALCEHCVGMLAIKYTMKCLLLQSLRK